MVIVSPILERENSDHGETIWNTAGSIYTKTLVEKPFLLRDIYLRLNL